MTSTVEDGIVENQYATINKVKTAEDNYQTLGKGDFNELKELPEDKTDDNETNGVSSLPGKIDRARYSESTSQPNDDSDLSPAKLYNAYKPFLPKIFMALLIVLLIAVIALSSVLYHIDQELSRAKSKTTNMEIRVEKVKSKVEKMALDKLHEKKGGIDLTENVTELIQKMNKLNSKMEKMDLDKLHEKKVVIDLTANVTELIQKMNKHARLLPVMEEEFKGDISSLYRNVSGSKKRIGEMENELKNDIDDLQNKTKTVSEFVQQLNMYIQIKEPKYNGKLNLTFKEIVKLTGIENKVTKDISVFRLLIQQLDQFYQEYKVKWGIEYKDVIRLSGVLDFKVKKSLPLLMKIDKLWKIFDDDFREKWNITFKELIRLTKKDDLKAITLPEIVGEYVSMQIPPVLEKIEYMYELFNKGYSEKWRIQFRDVVTLTKEIDFKVNATKIEVLQMIGRWYVDKFQDIWGNSFEGFIHVMKDRNESERTAILVNISRIANAEIKLNFLPATFGYHQGKLDLYGYIKIFYDNMWGTIYNNNGFLDHYAELVCGYGGYSGGVYDKGKYNQGNMNRDLMRCLISNIQCYPSDQNLTLCRIKTNQENWTHSTYDVGVKCYM